jgi:DNA-binding transcriptional ArsR family regulator
MYYRFVSAPFPSTDTGVFQAIADPTRRAILARLCACGGELTPTQIAGDLPVTLSAVSQHLKILRDSGLVTVRRAGRERWYRLDADPIREVAAWARTYERFWDVRVDALAAYLDSEADDEEGADGDNDGNDGSNETHR